MQTAKSIHARSIFGAIARLFTPSRKAEFANVFLEGTHETGHRPYLPDVAFANRWTIVIIGSSSNNCTPSAANTDFPLGIATDSADSANLDEPIDVALLGCTQGTMRVNLGGNVTAGDLLQSNGDGTAIKLLTTTGTFYCIGRAMFTGVAGDTIEFVPTFPFKVVNP